MLTFKLRFSKLEAILWNKFCLNKDQISLESLDSILLQFILKLCIFMSKIQVTDHQGIKTS